MEKVKQFLRVGGTFPSAVREALSEQGFDTFSAFCAANGLREPEWSRMMNGKMVPSDRQLAALIGTLGGDAAEWLETWFTHAQKVARSAAKAVAVSL